MTERTQTIRHETGTNVSADVLGINIGSRREQPLFHWFMCVVLASKPVEPEVVAETFKALKQKRMDTPQHIRDAGWESVLKTMHDGGYLRYDEVTAMRLTEACERLKECHQDSIRSLVTESATEKDCCRALKKFKGVGPKGIEMFMREVQPVYYLRGE